MIRSSTTAKHKRAKHYCCGETLPTIHDLLQHYEEGHAEQTRYGLRTMSNVKKRKAHHDGDITGSAAIELLSEAAGNNIHRRGYQRNDRDVVWKILPVFSLLSIARTVVQHIRIVDQREYLQGRDYLAPQFPALSSKLNIGELIRGWFV
jgi:hypothetical protein